MITKKDLLIEGYTEYKPNHFQICRRDKIAKRYFINIEYYDFELKDLNKRATGFTVSVQFQNTLYDNKELCPNIKFDTGLLTIEELETLINMLWLTLGLPYYELY